MGRGKIKVKKIDDTSSRQVTFSKRRQGLFKKAGELAILCEAEVGALVFSPAGKLHHFASSNLVDILNKFSLHMDNKKDEEKKDVDLSRGLEEKMNRLRFMMSMHLQEWGIKELQELEGKLEVILDVLRTRKFQKQTLFSSLPVTLQNKTSQEMNTTPPEESTSYHQYPQLTTNPTVADYPEKWIPPPRNVYKANFAGATFQEMNASGAGVIVRNCRGEFMAAQAKFLPEHMDETTTSSMAAKCAVEFAADYCFKNIILEGDSNDTITAIQNTNPQETSGIFLEIVKSINQLESCAFSHVQRCVNTAAHRIALYAINAKDEDVWLIKEPEFLTDILPADAVSINS